MKSAQSESTRFKEAMRQIMSVPKKEIDRREAEYRKARSEKKSEK